MVCHTPGPVRRPDRHTVQSRSAKREFESRTAVRTAVILLITWEIVIFSGYFHEARTLSGHNLLFLVLSGIATGLSWLFYL